MQTSDTKLHTSGRIAVGCDTQGNCYTLVPNVSRTSHPFDANSVKSYMSVVAAVTVLHEVPFGKVLSAFADFFGHCN